MQIDYAATAEINGDWCPVEVVAEHQPEEKQTWIEPGCAAELQIIEILYLDNGRYEALPESDWNNDLLDRLIEQGFAYLTRRKEQEQLEYALFCAA